MAEKALSTLHQQHKSASQYVALLDNAIEDLSGSQKLTEAEVDCIMELRGEQAVKSLEAQLKLWKRYIGKDKDLLVRHSHLEGCHTTIRYSQLFIPVVMLRPYAG